MRTRLRPALAVGMMAATIGCSQAPPTATTSEPQASEATRQIAVADEQMPDTSNMPEPLSVQALPQKLDPSQVVELPTDKLKELPAMTNTDGSNVQQTDGDRSVQQWRGRGYGRFGYGRFGYGRRFFYRYPYYYPYYSYGGSYYPYAYYPYTYAYYPYSYYSYYSPYYSYGYYPYYSYGAYYYPYYRRFGYGRFGYGRFGRRW